MITNVIDSKLLPLTDRLDKYVESIHANDEDRTKHIHVTDLSRCPVGVFLEKTGVRKGDAGVGKLRRFEVGHQVEEFVRRALDAAGIISKEIPPKQRLEWPDFNLVGTPDLFVNDKGVLAVVEVKSIHPFALDNMGGKPHPHYVEQLCLYLDRFTDHIGRLLYVSLDGRTEEYVIKYDKQIADAAKDKAKILAEAVKSGVRPPLLPYLVEDVDKKGNVVWKLDWRVKYCIQSGIHELCDPERHETLGFPDPDSWVRKEEYQAKKRNDSKEF